MSLIICLHGCLLQQPGSPQGEGTSSDSSLTPEPSPVPGTKGPLYRCLLNKRATEQKSTNRAPRISRCLHTRPPGSGSSRNLEDMAPVCSARLLFLLLHPSSLLFPGNPERHRWGGADAGKPSPGAELFSSGMDGVCCGALCSLSHLHRAVGLTQKESEKENFVSPGVHGSWALLAGRRGEAWPGKTSGYTEWTSDLLGSTRAPHLAAPETEAWKRQLGVEEGEVGPVFISSPP